MDGTFSTAPKLFGQLYVIQGNIDGVYLPLVYALLQHKTQVTHEGVFRVLEESGCDPRKVINYFETCFIIYFLSFFFIFFLLLHFSVHKA